MEPDLMKEWQALQREALQILRNGYPHSYKEIKKWDRKYQIIKEPSFENPDSWEIFECNDQPNIYVRTQWDKLQDLEKFQSPVERLKYFGKINPNITYEKNELGKESEKYLSKLRSLSLPVCSCENHLILDGVTYEFIVTEGMNKVSFQWWEGGSGKWKALDRNVKRIIDSLEG